MKVCFADDKYINKEKVTLSSKYYFMFYVPPQICLRPETHVKKTRFHRASDFNHNFYNVETKQMRLLPRTI